MPSLMDPSFKIIPINHTFFQVWKIQDLQMVSIHGEDFGIFYSNDSYVVLCVTDEKEYGHCHMRPREIKPGPPKVHIHIWIGSESLPNSAAVAIYAALELEDHLGGHSTQHREMQGKESPRFLSYFRDGMQIMKGNSSLAATNTETREIPRLYIVKNKRIPILEECPTISWNFITSRSVIILDSQKYIFVWNGKFSCSSKRLRGITLAKKLRNDHFPEQKCIVLVDEDQETEDLGSIKHRQQFEKYLPLSEKLLSCDIINEIEAVKAYRDLKLFVISKKRGVLKITEKQSGSLIRTDLNSQSCHILENRSIRIFIWIGRNVSDEERKEAFRIGQAFIIKKGLPHDTSISRVLDGYEPVEFKCLFKSWTELNNGEVLGKTYMAGNDVVTITDMEKVVPKNNLDISKLYDSPSLAAKLQMIDDGSQLKQVFFLKDSRLELLPETEYGDLYSDSCYLVLYQSSYRDTVLIYLWIGGDSNEKVRQIGYSKAAEMNDDRFEGNAVQVRIIQGREPLHFIALFEGKLIIFKGFGVRTENGDLTSQKSKKDCYLLQVRGTNKFVSHAVEMNCEASSLNTHNVYILFDRLVVYIWAGKRSTGDEREMSRHIASSKQGKRELIFVSEGQENSDFWLLLGGKQPYSMDKMVNGYQHLLESRLFQVSYEFGKIHDGIKLEEVFNYQQTDLTEEDLMLLDAWDSLFLWIGSKCLTKQRDEAIEVAIQYLLQQPFKRSLDLPISVVKQHHEPLNFIGFFTSWDVDYWMKFACLDDLRKQILSEHEISEANGQHKGCPLDVKDSDSREDVEFSDSNKYPLAILRTKNPLELPINIDPTRKEIYLTSEDFKKTFGMAHSEFMRIPRWKQVELKKKVGLF